MISSIVYIGKCIDRRNGTHLNLAVGASKRSQAGLHCSIHAIEFTDGRTGAGTVISVMKLSAAESVVHRLHTHSAIRANIGLSHIQIKKRRLANNRNNAVTNPVSDFHILQFSHDAGTRFQSVCAAAADYHSVNLINCILRAKQVRFPSSRSAAPHIHSGSRSFFRNDYRAAGGRICVLRISQFKTLDVGYVYSSKHKSLL